MCRISVIVPVYKVEEYLNRCVESILEQSFADFELILVDDGSPDNCPDMCDEWAKKDNRIKVIHQENAGVSTARNSGLDFAAGKYIAFCDSDDYWENCFLEKLYLAAEEHGADIVCAGFLYIINETTQIELHNKVYKVKLNDSGERQRYLHERLLKGRDGWAIWCRLFRTELIRRNNIRFCTECNNYAEDMGFVAKCVLNSETIVSVGGCLYNYIGRADSMMAKSESIIRLNDMNEVSYYLGCEYTPEKMGRLWKKYRAVSHYLIMYNQYMKVFQQGRLKELPDILKSITNYTWFRQNTVALFGTYRLLKGYYGKDDARRILLFSSYCLHQLWPLYRVTLGIYNRMFGYR